MSAPRRNAARMAATILSLSLGSVVLALPAEAASVDVVVDAHSGPWNYSSTLNPSFQNGASHQISPTVVNSGSGIAVFPGNSLTITYLAGMAAPILCAPCDVWHFSDADGDPAHPFNDTAGFPSHYMDPATYPINIMELVGTFADPTGTIVGVPFKIGNGPTTLIVPPGASALQMGVNDEEFIDNTGSYTVRVSGPSVVPIPGALALLGSALATLGFLKRRRAARAI